ncbi:MAG: sterol desaturase family protein [Pseudomonadota bacterium]
MSSTPQPQQPFSAAVVFARGAQVLLPCVVFAAVLWSFDAEMIYVLPMLLFFIAVFAWETLRPLQTLQMNVWQRWPANGLMWTLNMVIGSKLGQAIILMAVSYQVSYGSGWLTETFEDRVFIALFSVLVLDVWHYFFHRLMHSWGWLWRMHRVHHSDRDFDLTTGLRFHPLEGALTTAWMLAPALILGMPWYALMTNAILTLTVDYFTHANAELPPRLELWARYLLVTPSLHRIHHSVLAPEDRYNYSTTFIFWDRLFGTYKSRSAQKGAAPLTGVEEIPATRSSGSIHTLLMPFTHFPTTQKSGRPPKKRKRPQK